MYKDAYEHTRYFAEECGKRIAGETEVIKASDYIVKEFESYGVDVELHHFKLPICKITHSQFKAKVDGDWKVLKAYAGAVCKRKRLLKGSPIRWYTVKAVQSPI